MSILLTTQPVTRDPLTGIPIVLGNIRTTMDGTPRVTQVTGAPVGSVNQTPGTSPIFLLPAPPTGLPYGFMDAPQTGPLGPR
jgi:hypothetical protein